MIRQSSFFAITAILVIIAAAMASAEPIDISDSAMSRFLAYPFQFDYTTITSDSTLRLLVEAVDRQLTIAEYRQLKELISSPQDSLVREEYRREMENRYREILSDGVLAAKFRQWRQTTSDPVCRAFIDLVMSRRETLLADPGLITQAKQLARRIADQLYQFRFEVGGKSYRGTDIVALMESGQDRDLLQTLYRMQNDSAAILARDAARLYGLYSRMGEGRGSRSSFDYSLSRLSFGRSEWYKIAEDLKAATEAEYQACLAAVRNETGIASPAFFDIDHFLRRGMHLPDRYFSPAAADLAVKKLLTSVGLDSLIPKLVTVKADSAQWPALAVRFAPPYDVQLIQSTLGGFAYYRRSVAEIARSLPWVFADTTLPFLLRDYPPGTEEMMTGTFESWALDSAFLAANFAIPPDTLARFVAVHRWMVVFRLRQQLVYFLMEYYLSDGAMADPVPLYWALEKSLLGVTDSSYQWIETLLTGTLEKYPDWVAHQFARIKLNQILYTRFGETYAADRRTGPFLITSFCRPGRAQTLEDFVKAGGVERLSVSDIKRQWRLR